MNLSPNRRTFLSGSGAHVVAYAMNGPAPPNVCLTVPDGEQRANSMQRGRRALHCHAQEAIALGALFATLEELRLGLATLATKYNAAWP